MGQSTNTEQIGLIIAKLRRQGSDDESIEAKKCDAGLSKSVWETVSAFANTNGGMIILGISEEDGFNPVENFNVKRTRDQFISGCSALNPMDSKVEPIPDYEIQRVEFENHQLLVIEIKELPPERKPCYVKSKGLNNGSYKRVDDRDDRLSSLEIYELKNSMISSNADCEIVEEASIEDLNDEMTNLLLENQKNSKALRGVDSFQQGLSRLNVLDKSGDVRLAGLLVLGNYPQQFFPKLLIDVTSHPGTQKSDPNGPRFIDRVLCEGYLGEVIEDAIKATLKNLKTYSYVVGATRIEEPEIPIEVIREAIVNAVVHREYSFSFKGQAVSVDIYSDRVEITSPGGLWGGKTLKNLDDGQSRCRNAVLMKLLSILPSVSGGGAYSEGQGSGISLIKREMQSRALGEPVFKARLDSFTVVLSRGGAGGVDKLSRDILNLLSVDEPISIRELAEISNMNINTLRAKMAKYVKEGKVIPTAPPTDRYRKYLLAK